MSVGLVLLFPLVTIISIMAAVLVAVPRRRRLVAIDEREFPELARLRVTNTVARVSGVVVGLMILAPLMASLRFGLGVFLAPAVFAATQILAIVAAGILTHSAARTRGTAGLEVRGVRRYLPGRLTMLVASASATLALVLAGTTATAVADDMGVRGRAFSYFYPCDGVCSAGFSPWPGAFYSLPLAIALTVVVALAVLGVIIAVRRPRDASNPEIVRVDDLIRARAVESIVAAVGVGVAGTLVGVSFLVTRFVGNPVIETPLHLLVAGWGGVVVTIAALAVGLWCVVVLLLPGATAPLRLTPEAAAGTATVEA
ncbi:hypothetical protein [Tessaracoccus sp.]